MRSILVRNGATLGVLWAVCTLPALADPAAWTEVTPGAVGMLNENGHLLSASGAVLTDKSGAPLAPSCALGELSPTGPFRFFTQTGDRAKLLIVHDGGGACWESNTCGTVLDTNQNPAQAVFDPLITESAEELTTAGGVFDDTNPANPFRGWTKVYVPYCTGDIGWGNKVTVYPTPAGDLPIQHRGYANIRTALRWVEQHYDGTAAPDKVVVTGLSAGGYAAPGAILPEVRSLFPAITTRTYMIADSANGIVTDDFVQSARTNWGYENTLPNYLVDAINGAASGLPVRFYGALAARFPSTRLAQFQNAFDLNEATFYNIMRYVNEPFKWFDPQYLLPTLGLWSLQARLSVSVTGQLSNYRYYTAAGTEHTIMLFTSPEEGLGICSDEFFTERSANGLLFRRWVSDMVNASSLSDATNWRDATCFPNCLAAPKPGCDF